MQAYCKCNIVKCTFAYEVHTTRACTCHNSCSDAGGSPAGGENPYGS